MFEDSTKTTSGELIQIQMVQPSPEILVDVARFLKKHIAPKDRLLECYPSKALVEVIASLSTSHRYPYRTPSIEIPLFKDF